MKTLRLVQIGDVHYPDSRHERLGDLKDEAFPPTVAESVRLTPLQCVVRALAEEQERSPKALLFCGDLTSRGSLQGYKDCLDYLSEVLRLPTWRLNRVHAVPGNHDVDRAGIDVTSGSLFRKFDGFKQAWEDIGLPILTVEGPRDSIVRVGKVGAHIFSLNSSLGCGEKRHLPANIKDQLWDLLSAYIKSVGSDAAFETIGETLDTPGFGQDDINRICAAIRQGKESLMPIVLSHHNILPQALLRIDMYTEALNSGLVRSRFAQLSKPVLYCHGHIHENPIEIVQQVPIVGSSALVCISAPELRRGFNVLQIEYGSKNIPLGCRLFQYVLRLTDGEVRHTEHRLPFYKPDQLNLRRVGHPLLPRVLSNLPENDVRLPDLHAQLRKQDETIDAADLADSLKEGQWLGFVQLSDDQYEAEFWTVRRIVRQ